jgi:hypothetical protein
MWLPKNLLNPQLVKDEKTGRQINLYLPSPNMAESPSHYQELVQAAQEKAIAEMRAKGVKPQSKLTRKEVGMRLKEFREYQERKKQRTINDRYVTGWRE